MSEPPFTVWILINGDGSDGNEMSIDSLYSTEEKALEALEQIQNKKYPNHSIEEWAVE